MRMYINLSATLTWFWFLIVFCTLLAACDASLGDRTQFFRNCRENCERQNCSANGLDILEHAVKQYRQSIFDQLFQWNCMDECQYSCMWRTVDAFKEREWSVPQFYGKWPFVRFMGLQEPASVFFSILNFIAHVRMLRKFRRQVLPDSPCYNLWHIFAFVSLNGWVWSTVFHTRDFPLTELLDYVFAYSMVLVLLYCMILRMLHRFSLFLRALITLVFMSLYVNYFAYLSVGEFNYSFNMSINIVTGVVTALGWLFWCYKVRYRRPYSKIMLRFCILSCLATSLEVLDFPPIFWLLDAHALWHLATVPLVPIFYNFIIEDCQVLRKERRMLLDTVDKEI